MEVKFVFALIGTVVSLTAFYPYIRDIFRGKTKPHAYTWLVWIVVQGIATAGIVYGGGRWGALELGIATVLVVFIFILSLKYGTKNVTRSDAFSLAGAVIAALAWVIFKNARLSVLLVTVIDMFGYVPTIRKTFQDPASETFSTWALFAIGNLFSIAALSAYNWLTLVFVVCTTLGNALIAFIIILRKRKSA